MKDFVMRHELLTPLILMIVLTAIVWLYMYILRLGFMFKHKINPQDLATPHQKYAILPERINYPAYNLSNLFELPVLFYILCVLVIYLDISSQSILVYSWIFVIFRIFHSLIHCTYNTVKHRFVAYAMSSIALWLMLITVIGQVFL